MRPPPTSPARAHTRCPAPRMSSSPKKTSNPSSPAATKDKKPQPSQSTAAPAAPAAAAANPAPQNKPKQRRAPLTHFLCIPLVTPASRPQLKKSLAAFRDEVTVSGPGPGPGPDFDGNGDAVLQLLPREAVRPVGTLHLTLGVMSLWTEERVRGALGLLRRLDLEGMVREAYDAAAKENGVEGDANEDGEGVVRKDAGDESDTASSHGDVPLLSPALQISAPAAKSKATSHVSSEPSTSRPPASPSPSPPPPLRISLTSLQSMHPPSRTTILYAIPTMSHASPPHPALQHLASALRHRFTQAGYLEPDERPLLLHATIVNTVYVRGRGHRLRRLTLDARSLLQRYEEMCWMRNVVLESVAVCRMGAKRVEGGGGDEEDEEYVVEGEVGLMRS